MLLHDWKKYIKPIALFVVVVALAVVFITRERLTHDWRYFNAIDHLVGEGGGDPSPDEAFKTLERLAGAGHNASACFMAYIYFHGYEDPEIEYKLASDDDKVVHYGEQAAETGCFVAQYLLGIMYYNKYKTYKFADDKKLAIKWLKPIAEDSGYAHATKKVVELDDSFDPESLEIIAEELTEESIPDLADKNTYPWSHVNHTVINNLAYSIHQSVD